MRRICSKTDNLKCKAGRAAPTHDKHNASSRSGLLFRLGSAALALLLAVGGVSLLRSSFNGRLPLVQAAVNTDARLEVAESQVMITNDVYPNLKQLNVKTSAKLTINPTADITMTGEDSSSSEVDLWANSTLHLKGKLHGYVDRLSVIESSQLIVYLNQGAIFDVDYRLRTGDDIICLGCNYGSN